jgi:hypothetical protein
VEESPIIGNIEIPAISNIAETIIFEKSFEFLTERSKSPMTEPLVINESRASMNTNSTIHNVLPSPNKKVVQPKPKKIVQKNIRLAETMRNSKKFDSFLSSILDKSSKDHQERIKNRKKL